MSNHLAVSAVYFLLYALRLGVAPALVEGEPVEVLPLGSPVYIHDDFLVSVSVNLAKLLRVLPQPRESGSGLPLGFARSVDEAANDRIVCQRNYFNETYTLSCRRTR